MTTAKLKPIFTDPPDTIEEEAHCGVLFSPEPIMSWLEAARVYGDTAKHLIARAIKNGVPWDEAHPALFMCRHVLELYLKALLPDWKERKKKYAQAHSHSIGYLASELREILSSRYNKQDIEELCQFLDTFDSIDPKAMVFRFPDGAIGSYGQDNKPDYELWVDFRNLRDSFDAVTHVLDHLCLRKMETK